MLMQTVHHIELDSIFLIAAEKLRAPMQKKWRTFKIENVLPYSNNIFCLLVLFLTHKISKAEKLYKYIIVLALPKWFYVK